MHHRAPSRPRRKYSSSRKDFAHRLNADRVGAGGTKAVTSILPDMNLNIIASRKNRENGRPSLGSVERDADNSNSYRED